jgi:hypothetical protein
MSSNKITTSKRFNTKPMVFELDIKNPPGPLVLLINPATLEIKYASKITEQRVRWTGLLNPAYIFQAHHDELDVITATGKTAMFMTTEKGLTRVDRRNTLAYENIEKLIAMYRNNGANYNTKPNSTISPCAIETLGRVIISYDGFVYKGHFTNFSTTENEATPFNIDFNFEYKISRTFSIDQVLESGILNRVK